MPPAVTLKWPSYRWESMVLSLRRLERLIVCGVLEPMMQPKPRSLGYVLTIAVIFALGLSQTLLAQQEESATRDPTRLIKEALASGNVQSSRQLLSGFLAQPRLSADVLQEVGANLANLELYEEAAQVFARCVNDYPKIFAGYYNLSLAQLALRKYPEALDTLNKAPRGSPSEDLQRTYMHGKVEMGLGQDAQAERDLSAAFAAAPQEENFALDLGLLYIREFKYQQAVNTLQKANALRKNDPYLQLGLALSQFLAGQNLESVETCKSLLAVQPNSSPVRLMMAFGLYMGGKTAEAEKVAAEGLRDPNPSPYLYYLDAVTLMKLQSKDTDVILSDLARAAREIPGCSLCYLALSKLHEKTGEQKLALDDLEKAIKLDPSFAEAWYRLSVFYNQSGRHAEAERARRRFEELKENKANRETDMLRNIFLNALGGESSTHDSR
jgi:tetratricopeptide (TPR) repeat protein